MILAMNFFVVVENVVRHDNFETSLKAVCEMPAKRFWQRGGFYSYGLVGLGAGVFVQRRTMSSTKRARHSSFVIIYENAC